MTTGKPLTKALHTVRIVGAVARYIARDWPREARKARPELTPAYLLLCVLSVLENEGPTDPELYADCVSACEAALIFVDAERVRVERERSAA